MFRRYPLDFRIGTDICHIPRIKSLIQADQVSIHKHKLYKFLLKIFTPPEFEIYYHEKRFLNGLDINARYIAGRWAAKEAIIKAERRDIRMSNIVIKQRSGSGPQAYILREPMKYGLNWYKDEELVSLVRKTHDGFLGNLEDLKISTETIQLLRNLSKNETAKEVDVSISHDGDYATAMACVPYDQFHHRYQEDKLKGTPERALRIDADEYFIDTAPK